MKSPYVYFGGKAKVAAEVWSRFGQVDTYIEPFFGSGASIAPGASIRAIVVIAALALFFASCTGENPRDAHFQIYGCSPSNLQPDGRCGLSLK